MKNSSSGYTLIEIVITLFIAATLFAMGVFTLQTYLPKQRLLDSMETVEQVLNRAQFEATSRSTWSCISYDVNTSKLSIYMDVNLNHATAGAGGCGDDSILPKDILITTQQLRENVVFVVPSNCTNGVDSAFDFATLGPLWFDSAGVPKICVGGTCNTISAQIFVSSCPSNKLPSSNCAREIEAVSSGLISIVERNSPGYITTLYAKTASQTGVGACE